MSRGGESGDGDQQMLTEIERILHEVEGCLPELRTTGVFDTSSLTPAQTRYLLVQEELRSLRELYEELPDLQHPDVLLARCCRLRKSFFCRHGDCSRIDL